MKNYKKGLLVVAVVSAMSLMAAESKIIQVTTFEDEDGENLSKCSLREAIRTAHENKSYGGCNVGNKLVGMEDFIQLEAGEYILTKELVPQSPLMIYGQIPYDLEKKSELTGEYPARVPLKTIINAQNKSRIFNTSAKASSLDISNVLLKNGRATTTAEDSGHGGALYIGGRLNLFNTSIIDSYAQGEGGAIYFIGKANTASIGLNGGVIEGNKAKNGAVFAMDCYSDLNPVVVDLEWTHLGIVRNGDANTQSIMDFCGVSRFTLTASTVAKNTVSAQTDAAVIRAVSTPQKPVHNDAYFSFVSDTIVENTGTVFAYDQFGVKSFVSTLLAFNSSPDECRYALGEPLESENITFMATNNALADRCKIPAKALGTISQNQIITSRQLGSLLSPMKEASAYTNFTPLYYPLNLHNDNDLVDTGHVTCSGADQRSIVRTTQGTLLLSPEDKNTCDIGSVELMRLTAADIVNLRNSSYPNLVKVFEDEIVRFKAMLKDPANKDKKIQIEEELAKDEALLVALKKHAKYRGIYIDPFELALPAEVATATGELRLKKLDIKDYHIETEALGVGQLKEIVNGVVSIDGDQDPHQRCEWNSELQRIIMYRTNHLLTNSADTEYCRYTIKDKETGVSSAGILAAVFVNMAPIAVDDEYRISRDSGLKVTVDLLKNDNDDADGPMDSLIEKPSTKYYVNFEGNETPIRFEKIDSGLNMTAERQGPCPDTHIRDICYGGKITFEVKNNLSQFDYQARYNIFDVHGTASELATVRLRNTVTNTSTSSSGGGSFGLYGLLGLVGLALYRRRIKK